MAALSLGMGAALASTIMRLDMPDGNNPRRSIGRYHELVGTGAHDKFPRTPEWTHYRDRIGMRPDVVIA
jgi:hypothetical protein